MLKTMRLISVAAVAALALPALAGSWPPIAPRKSPNAAPAAVTAPASPRSTDSRPPQASDFEFVGGDTGWQLSQHKYVFAGGRLVMSDECDHTIRIVKAPTPGEIESVRQLSPGA